MDGGRLRLAHLINPVAVRQLGDIYVRLLQEPRRNHQKILP